MVLAAFLLVMAPLAGMVLFDATSRPAPGWRAARWLLLGGAMGLVLGGLLASDPFGWGPAWHAKRPLPAMARMMESDRAAR